MPNEEDLEFAGCIYNTDPEDDFYKLAPDDLKNMSLVGLPIRVEHHDTDSGEVIDSWVSDDGKAYVKWRFSDTPRGWGLSKLVRDGRVCELSLKHAEFEDGTKAAMEVSIVEKGARPQTFISRGKQVKYICASIRFREAPMSNVTEQPRYYERNADGSFAPVQQAAAPPVQVAAAAPVQVAAAAPQEPPPVKRGFEEDSDGRRNKIAKLAKLAEQILPLLPTDSDLSSTFVTSISEMVENHQNTEQFITAAAQKRAEHEASEMKSRSRDRDLAKEIVDGIVSLWGDLTLPVDDEKKNIMMRVYEDNPDFARVSQPWVVAASKVGELRHAMVGAAAKSQTQILQEQLQKAQQQIFAIGNMQGSAPAPVSASACAPAWVPVAAAQPAAVPQAMVAASGKEQHPNQFAMPDILNNLPAFNGMVGKVRTQDIYTSRSS